MAAVDGTVLVRGENTGGWPTTRTQGLGRAGLDEGAAADLVVYAEDPRQNLKVLYEPQRIILGGKVIR